MGTTGPKLTDGVLAYLAGYFDGEGCIRFESTPSITVTSIYPYTLHVFRDCFGGSVKPQAGNERHKPAYRWRAYGDNAVTCLEALQPHLREKRVQALLCLEIRKTPPGSTRDGMVTQLNHTKSFEYGD